MNQRTNRLVNQSAKRYMPGLDGLRALSILSVIAYHFHLVWAPGGFAGVEIFFVISGYLITDQLLLEWKIYQKLNLRQFWIRRLRRLVPAMVCMLTLVAIWLIGTDTSRFLALKGDFLSSLFYVSNWWLIFHKISYFQSFGPPSPIGHLWSLAIEEQFYFCWPLVLAIALKMAPTRRTLTLGLLNGAAISILLMALIYVSGTDPSRVYYGTDTRAFALLIGGALAVIWPSWRLSGPISTAALLLLDFVGGLGLCALVLFIYCTHSFDDILYPAGFLGLSIVTVLVIAVVVHPASYLGKMMGCRPLRWIGKRSYSLYLWHYPVIVLSSPALNTGEFNLIRMLLQLSAAFILGALSYKYVEEPIRRGNLKMGLLFSRASIPGSAYRKRDSQRRLQS